jgi:chromosome segregation ATPase
MASALTEVQSPATHTPVASPKVEAKKNCCNGFHWTHVITIPASLTGIGGAVYGFFASNYLLGGIGAIGALASIVGTVAISVLKPQKELETNVEELNKIQTRLEGENSALRQQIQELQATSRNVVDMITSANAEVEASSSDFRSLNETLQAELSSAREREAALKTLLTKYEATLSQMIVQAHSISTIDTSITSSITSLREVNTQATSSVDKVKAAAAIICTERRELGASTNEFSQLNGQFQEKIQLLGTLITLIEEKHGSMSARIQELEKVQLELDKTKKTIQLLVTRMGALTSAFSEKFETIDQRAELGDVP